MLSKEEIQKRIRSITYTTSEHATHAHVELHSGFQFEVESQYVSHISNAFGEKYAYQAALELLQKFDQYFKIEQLRGLQKEEA
jgi:hypothetical protein